MFLNFPPPVQMAASLITTPMTICTKLNSALKLQLQDLKLFHWESASQQTGADHDANPTHLSSSQNT